MENEYEELVDCSNEYDKEYGMVLHVYNGDTLIGKDYTHKDRWLHRWFDHKINSFERGSWPGRCAGEGMDKWRYEERREDTIIKEFCYG